MLESAIRVSSGSSTNLRELVVADSVIAGLPASQAATIFEASHSKAHAHLWRGLRAWSANQFELAEQEFESAQSSGLPPWRTAWYLALCIKDDHRRWSWRRYESARDLLRLVLAHNPEFVPARIFWSYLTGYYAQWGQDILIEDFFYANPPRTNFFVDVGAYDGVHLSNSRRLFECGWAGLCIEPGADQFVVLEQLYAGTAVRTLPIAIALEEGFAVLTREQTGSALVREGGPSGDREGDRVRVQRLASVLSECAVHDLDVLLIDAEGVDYEVLASFPFDRIRPQLIVIETNSVAEVSGPVLELMSREGYLQWHDNRQDLFFRAQETVAAANFWMIKTLLPERAVPAQPHSRASASALSLSLRGLLRHHNFERAHWLVVQAIAEGCSEPALIPLRDELAKISLNAQRKPGA